jgi:hypothetical protein
VLINQKYLAHGAVILYLVASVWLPGLGWEDNLYRFGNLPGFQYSEMNGYGPFLSSIRAFQLYWGLAAILLLAGSYAYWPRGSETSFSTRSRFFRHSLKAPGRKRNWGIFVATLLTLFIGQGAYVFYNTHMLNRYETADMKKKNQADYEKKYSSYMSQPQLQFVSIQAQVDFYPSESRMNSILTATLKNTNDVDVEEIFLNIPVARDSFLVSMEGIALQLIEEDEKCEVYRYKLPRVIHPGESIVFTYNLKFAPQGFVNDQPEVLIVENGSFFNNTQMFPTIGYNPGAELATDRDRERHGLSPKPRMPAINDENAWQTNYVSHDATWINFEATVSTSQDQIGIAPGYLQKQWQEGDRSYFHYKMDHKVINYYAFMSGRYEIKRDVWKGVNIEVYYHKGHEYNLYSFIAATKDGLDYFNQAFGPYQHRQFRIIEFPRYETFAQAFPNTIPYSEAIGFIARVDPKNPKDIDYPYYVTAHELAHQWWAHQVISAGVQGATLLSESLSQYSSLMIMEKKFGRDKMRRYLQYEMDKYLQKRAKENIAEKPLYLNENQSYIHYNKGSLALYALRETIGEETLNAAIRKFRDANAYQEPPYTNALKFVESLKANIDSRHHELIDDQLTRITLYDNRLLNDQVTKEGETYTVEVSAIGRKVYADGLGQEEEATFTQPFTLVVEAEEGKVIHTQTIELSSGENRLSVQLQEKPRKILLDPQSIWIDKNRSDNEISLKL